jgi:mono/diheme cytochrome c family protein
MRRACVLIGGLSVLLVTARGASPVPLQQQPDRHSSSRTLVSTYCVTCHNERAKVAGLMLDKMDVTRIGAGAEPWETDTWEKVVRKLRGGMMPPQGMPRPDQATLESFTSGLETALDRQALAMPNPGRASLHRLNRTEYANAVRDLLDLEIDVTELLPADDESDGFDNIADVLKVSPSLLEQYLAASRKVSSLAVGDGAAAPISQVYPVPPDLAQDDHIEGLPLGTRGGLLIRHNFPLDAEYQFSVKLLRNIVGYISGLEWPHQLEITVDGERVFIAPVGGPEDNKMSDENMSAAGDKIDERLKVRVPIKAGPRAVGVSFIRKTSAESDEPLQPHTRDHDLQNMNGIPLVDYLDIRGPYEAIGPGVTPSRRRIFACRPSSAREEAPCARKILSTLARRAYRRPVTDAEVDSLIEFYNKEGNGAGHFEAGIQNALRLILASPKFLFRAESDPVRAATGTVYRLGDLELASRLSFFLWSSIPDDELLTVAAQGKLKDPAVLDQQVRRMLADPRADALVQNFAGQWLFLRNLQSHLPDNRAFPDFDHNLRQAFRRETELLFDSIIREDRSVLDLLNANYTFVNERLARHYGIPNVYGSRFRRVTLTDENRRGLLGQGSVLTVTSYPNRTSPVLRGKWILENILGSPPPPPPPNVPALTENGEDGKVLSVRERLEEHRKNPVCASCHRVMDPLGFSLENFDAVGQWRTKEEGGPVDASGQLADGSKVDGPVSLRKAIMRHPEQFVGTMTEKLLTYALGRGVESYDMPIVRSVARDAARSNYRFSSIVLGIVKSTPFQMRKASSELVN